MVYGKKRYKKYLVRQILILKLGIVFVGKYLFSVSTRCDVVWSIFGFISVCTIRLVPLQTLNSLLGFRVCRSVLRISVISRSDAAWPISVLSRYVMAYFRFYLDVVRLGLFSVQ